MLSDEGVKDAITGTEVEQKVKDCIQDWGTASSKAVQEMMQRQREQEATEAAKAAKVQFVISLKFGLGCDGILSAGGCNCRRPECCAI